MLDAGDKETTFKRYASAEATITQRGLARREAGVALIEFVMAVMAATTTLVMPIRGYRHLPLKSNRQSMSKWPSRLPTKKTIDARHDSLS